jgi:hypothetical protein
MELFQILGSVFLLVVTGYYAYKTFSNRYFEILIDKYGRRHKRDVRNGQFIKIR